jgi:tetratricopeptide (TPR) repeat protein
MSDPLRTETSRTAEPTSRAEREAKIEQLLLAGLDHYFAGQYDQAINIWTRALFLDRSHARARAYIDRARSAQAERQRESEALLHDGADAVRRGDSSEARRLLDAAMLRGGASDEVLALLDRVERLEHRIAPDVTASDDLAAPRLTLEDAPPSSRSNVEWLALGALVLVIVAAVASAAGSTRQEWTSLVERALSRRSDRAPAVAPVVSRDFTLPVPRRAEGALARARALVSSGKLRDALSLLDAVRPTDPERSEADRLRTGIQRQLIEIGPLPASQPATPVAGGSRP